MIKLLDIKTTTKLLTNHSSKPSKPVNKINLLVSRAKN